MAKYKFELLSGRHDGPGPHGAAKVYQAGDIISTDDPLDKMFPNKFKRLGVAMKKARHSASPDEDDMPALSEDITAANFDNVSPVDEDDDDDHPPTIAAKKKARKHADEDTVEPEVEEDEAVEEETPKPKMKKRKKPKMKRDEE